VPINSKTLGFSEPAADQQWQLMRRRWERLHIGRVLLDLAAFACFLLAAL